MTAPTSSTSPMTWNKATYSPGSCSGPTLHSERPRPGHIRQIPSRLLCLWPPQTLLKPRWRKAHHYSPICRWMCLHGTRWKSPTDHCRPLCRSVKVLWTYHQPWKSGSPSPISSEHASPQPNITNEGVQLKCMESFKYLGSTISSDGSLDSKISRIHKVVQALKKNWKVVQ